MILLMKQGNEDKYKYDVSREAVINKEDYDQLKNWASKELIYNNILKVSGFGSKDEVIKKKLKIKEELEENPYLVMIKQIVQCIPTIDINELFNCNADQLLFYIVFCEEMIGQTLVETNPLKTNVFPKQHLETKKKAEFSQEDLVDVGMNASSNDLMSKLNKHGSSVKQFVPKQKKDPFEE